MNTDAGPVGVADRIVTLDVLRGVAICGILLMNIPEMGMLGPTRPAFPAAWNADWIAWGIQSTLFNGTMRGLFTMLFGAGMLLMLRRAEGPGGEVTPIDVWLRRCLALLALGIINWLVLFWPGEILFNYGVTGFVLLAFRTARVRTLVAAGLLCLVVVSVGFAVPEYRTNSQFAAGAAASRIAPAARDEEQRSAATAWQTAREQLRPAPEAIAAERRQRTSVTGLVAWSWGVWSAINVTDIGWLCVLESLSFMLFGMALYRAGILTGEAPTRTYLHLVGWGYLGGLAIRLVNLYLRAAIGFGVPSTPGEAWTMVLPVADFEAGRVLLTLGHLGLVVLLFRSGMLGRATSLRALGRMALTTYVAQSALTSLLFYGFGQVGRFGFAGLMGIAAAIWIVTGVFCRWWLARRAMGPTEALLRAVAYSTFGSARRRRQTEATLATSPAI